jgi:hypothetical protein
LTILDAAPIVRSFLFYEALRVPIDLASRLSLDAVIRLEHSSGTFAGLGTLICCDNSLSNPPAP